MRHILQLALITFSWLVGLNIDWDCLLPHCIMGSYDPWEFPPFFRPRWQSLCTALTAGICLPLVGLCKGTVKESIHLSSLIPQDVIVGKLFWELYMFIYKVNAFRLFCVKWHWLYIAAWVVKYFCFLIFQNLILIHDQSHSTRSKMYDNQALTFYTLD